MIVWGGGGGEKDRCPLFHALKNALAPLAHAKLGTNLPTITQSEKSTAIRRKITYLQFKISVFSIIVSNVEAVLI